MTTPSDLDALRRRVQGVIDAHIAAATLALSEVGLAPARNYIAFMDELWRALRGAPGLVDRADTLTRVNRQKGMAQIMMTHSLADLDALPTEEDRAKAKGFVERCAVTILGGLPPRELDAVAAPVLPVSPVIVIAIKLSLPAAAAGSKAIVRTSFLAFTAAAPTTFRKSTEVSRRKLLLQVIEKSQGLVEILRRARKQVLALVVIEVFPEETVKLVLAYAACERIPSPLRPMIPAE